MKRVLVASVAPMLAQFSDGFAAGGSRPLDGNWTGSATSTVEQCKSAKVTVTVEGMIVTGQAQFANDAPNINGTVREDGTFNATIGWQHLTGKFSAMSLRECSKTATVNGKCCCNARAIGELEQLMGLLPSTAIGGGCLSWCARLSSRRVECRNSLIETVEQGTAKIQTTPRGQIHPSCNIITPKADTARRDLDVRLASPVVRIGIIDLTGTGLSY